MRVGTRNVIFFGTGKNRGSSPCVWGQADGLLFVAMPSGIIPMRVGTRSPLSFAVAFCEDHPHACGDKKNILEHCARR